MRELTSFTELTGSHARAAAASRTALREFFAAAEKIARPNDGIENLFLVLTRLADATWIEGTIRIEIRVVDDSMSVTIISDLGLSLWERVVPATVLAVSYDELRKVLYRYPGIALPLQFEEEDGALVLTPLFGSEPQHHEGEEELHELATAPHPRVSERPTVPPSFLPEIPIDAIAPEIAHNRPTTPAPADAEQAAIADAERHRDPRREDDD